MKATKQSNHAFPTKWIRTQVAEPCWDVADYVRRRLGLANLPLAWTYLIHFFLFGKDPEEICQHMAASGHLQLQPVDELQMELQEEHTHNGTTE